MTTKDNNRGKVVLYIELHPFEKAAYLKWIQGRYHSISEAIRCHIRKVTGLDPESQEENSPNSPPALPMSCLDQQNDPSAAGGLNNQNNSFGRSQQNSQPDHRDSIAGPTPAPVSSSEKNRGKG